MRSIITKRLWHLSYLNSEYDKWRITNNFAEDSEDLHSAFCDEKDDCTLLDMYDHICGIDHDLDRAEDSYV